MNNNYNDIYFKNTYTKNTEREKFTTTLNKDILDGMKAYKNATKQDISKMIEVFFHEMLSSHEKQQEFYKKLTQYKGTE